tara:strand:+ start:7188 stop:7370 length:183 start_codon:yes stop_codon:yes gene_type:complete
MENIKDFFARKEMIQIFDYQKVYLTKLIEESEGKLLTYSDAIGSIITEREKKESDKLKGV